MLDYAFICRSFLRNYGKQTLLCVLWLVGLLCGFSVFAICKSHFFSLMCLLPVQSVSIVGLLFVFLFPFFFSYLSFLLNQTIVIMFVCFVKAAAFGFSICALAHLFGSAFWLMGLLYLFSDGFCLFLLLAMWLRQCDRSRSFRSCIFPVTFLFCVLAAAVDYFVISPFLQGLF